MEIKTVKIEIEKNKIVVVKAKQTRSPELVEYEGRLYVKIRLSRKKEPIYTLFALGN